MKYEGKLYGKVAGKYIEVKDHVSNEKLNEMLEGLVTKCRASSNEFLAVGMETSAATSSAMAHAYQVVINIIKGEPLD